MLRTGRAAKGWAGPGRQQPASAALAASAFAFQGRCLTIVDIAAEKASRMRRQGLAYWVLVGLSAASLILVFVQLAFVQNNRSIQAEINQRQQFINQSIRLGRVNEALIRSIAQTAVSENDENLRDLLSQQGITINVTAKPPGGAPAGASPGPASGGSK